MTKNLKNEQVKYESISMLYVLLNKFGDKISKEKLKEMITLTDIGKMIRDEGIEQGFKKGIEEGKAKGKAELVIKLLMKKFKKLPDGYTDKIKTLSDETLETIASDIFDIGDVKELEKYF